MRKITSLLFLFLSLIAHAQVTTSGINGQVKDSKEFLPGATIQAIHLPSGTRYGSITNADGRYTLQGMRPGGPYEITISFIGYQSQKIQDIQLKLGESYELNAELKDESISLQEVTVTGKAGFNSSKTGAGTSISIRQLNTLPTVTRSLNDMTRMTPQATVNSNGAVSFAGANNRYNSFQIDGAMNNDVFGLTSNGTNGGQASTEPVSLETIEQIQINIAPFDVRQSGFTGGGINAITKSGTNEYKGSVYFFGNNQKFIGKTPGALEPGEKREHLIKQHDYQWGVTLGGPIIKNKLFFYANYENTDKSYPTSNNLNDGSGVTQETADAILNHLKAKTNNAYNANFDGRNVFTRSHKAGVKIDWNINDRNTLTARYSYVDAERLSFPRSQYSLSSSDEAFTFNSKTNSWIVELNSRIKNSMNNELRASYVRVRDNRDLQGDPFPNIKIYDNRNTILLGSEYSSAANRLDQDIISLTNNFNWLVGNHNLTLGTHNEFYCFENLFIQNLYGSYTFNSVAEFLEDSFNQYYYGQSNVERTGRSDYAPHFKAMQVGFYLQDNWNINSNLSLTYGIRMDIPVLLDTPHENPDFNASAIAQANDVKTNVRTKSTPLWSPRVGFRWFTDDSHRHLLRGGVGIFTGRIPFVWISNSFTNTGMDFLKYSYTSKADIPQGVYFNTNPYTQYEMLQNATAVTSEVDVFDRKFKFSQNLRFNLAYEHQFNFGLKATLEGLYSKTLNDVIYKDLNIKATGKTVNDKAGIDFDNRPTYTSRVNDKFTNIMYLGNTSKGYTYNLSLKLEQNLPFGLDLSAAYTYGESKSVNSGSSSVAYSNWRYNEIISKPNAPELSFSDFNTPHRIVASVTYSKAYAKHFKTTVSLIYTGQSGAPYNVTYNGDINGDGSNGNDLIFIPTDSQIDQMEFDTYKTELTPGQQKTDLKAFLASADYLKDHRGEYFKRNHANLDFEHHFDLRLMQDFTFKAGKRTHTLQLTFDAMNIGNLFNHEWGNQSYLANNSYSPIKYSVDKSGKGKYQYLSGPDYKPVSISDIYSRWRGQLGIRYIF